MRTFCDDVSVKLLRLSDFFFFFLVDLFGALAVSGRKYKGKFGEREEYCLYKKNAVWMGREGMNQLGGEMMDERCSRTSLEFELKVSIINV